MPKDKTEDIVRYARWTRAVMMLLMSRQTPADVQRMLGLSKQVLALIKKQRSDSQVRRAPVRVYVSLQYRR